MSQGNILYLSRTHVEQVGVSMAEIIDALEFMFREKAAGRVEMPPKPGIHPRPDSFLHAMPAYVERQGAAGIKWISAYPGNPANGLPYITGLIVLNDPDTGLPLSVMDATWITAMRTGAASALAGKIPGSPGGLERGHRRLWGAGAQPPGGLLHSLPGGAGARLRHRRSRCRESLCRRDGRAPGSRGDAGRDGFGSGPGDGHRRHKRSHPARSRPCHSAEDGWRRAPLPARWTSTPTGRGTRFARRTC